MPITIKWTTPDKDTICWRFESVWTWDEFDSAKQSCIGMVNNAGKPVDVILDFEMSNHLPAHTLVQFGTTLRQNVPHNLNQIRVVGANDLLRKVCAILRRLYPDQMARVSEGTSVHNPLDKPARIQAS